LKVEEKGKDQVILEISDEESDREAKIPRSMEPAIVEPKQEEMEIEESEEEDDLREKKYCK
jgi:hypothetical protein